MNLSMFSLIALSALFNKGTCETIRAHCDVQRNLGGNNYDDNISGMVILSQTDDGPTVIEILLNGFGQDGARQRGFHIHGTGNILGGCGNMGGHFNPAGMDHGARNVETRHVGDLGNIEVDDAGYVEAIIEDHLVSLSGEFSVIGRAIVVHEGTDDLGLGGDEGSRLTGNAGRRPACCVIFQTEPLENMAVRSYTATASLTSSGVAIVFISLVKY